MDQSSLQFVAMGGGLPFKAYCRRCKRRFVASPKVGERDDDVILRLRAEFERHICYETGTNRNSARRQTKENAITNRA